MTIAERITRELLHEQASLWYINDEFGAKVMVKLTSPVIKEIMKDCRVEFLFGRDNLQSPAVFHYGLRIYDDAVNYTTVLGTDCMEDQHVSLQSIMNRSYTYIHFHSELGFCTATAKLIFSTADQLRVLNMLGSTEKLYCGKMDQKVLHSIDCFVHSIKLETRNESVYEIETFAAEAELSEWTVMQNYVIGHKQTSHFIINDRNEGSVLEREVVTVLDSLFKKNLYLNPQIARVKGFRELTDIFALNDYGLFLIETKALGVIDRAGDKPMEKKVSGLQKQISTGIGQIVGAAKKINEGAKLYDKDFQEIQYKKKKFPHCIVLVSELLAFGDWKQIELEILVAISENSIYLNIIDLLEFMQYIGHARGSADRLNLMLIERVEEFVKHETIHLKLNVVDEQGKSEP